MFRKYQHVERFGTDEVQDIERGITWAKLVRSEFKEHHSKIMGAPIIHGEKMIEERIVEKYVTDTLVEKEYAKIVTTEGGWRSQFIPRLFGVVYHALVTESMWDTLKEFNRPKVDFKTLYSLTVERIKTTKSGLFA